MFMSFPAAVRKFFLIKESTGEISRSLWNFLDLAMFGNLSENS